MKLTKNALKGLIMEVVKEGSVLLTSPLTEATQWTQYGRVMDMMKGDVESVTELSILTPENPHAKPLPPEKNALRQELWKKDMASMGYGFRSVSGMYGGPEDSYFIPHMSHDDAALISYRYGQESFVHAYRQVATEPMLYQMVEVDYSRAIQDQNYSADQYGPLYDTNTQIATTVAVESNDLMEFFELAKAKDYYSYIPGKQGKEDLKFKVDFYPDDGPRPLTKGPRKTPSGLGPKYIREGTFLNVPLVEVRRSKNFEVKELSESIQERVRKVCEKERMGGSKMHNRQMILIEKKRLYNLIRDK